MRDAHHVKHLKRALLVLRSEAGGVAGMAVALRAEGRDVLAAPAGLARGLAEGRLRLVHHEAPELLHVDDEAGLGLLGLPAEGNPQPLRALAAAPTDDGASLLLTGAGLTVPLGEGRERHLWITRGARLAGRLHSFAEGQKQEEFRYLLDLPSDSLPPGSPVVRSSDGALIGILDAAPAPEPSFSLAIPIREAVALVQRLGPRPEEGRFA